MLSKLSMILMFITIVIANDKDTTIMQKDTIMFATIVVGDMILQKDTITMMKKENQMLKNEVDSLTAILIELKNKCEHTTKTNRNVY